MFLILDGSRPYPVLDQKYIGSAVWNMPITCFVAKIMETRQEKKNLKMKKGWWSVAVDL